MDDKHVGKLAIKYSERSKLDLSKFKSDNLDLKALGELSTRDISRVISSLRLNSFVKKLDLSALSLDDNQVAMIVELLSKNHTINELDLSGNRISNNALFLIDSLKGNAFMKSLNLSNNLIPHNLIDGKFQAAIASSGLENLDLSGNKFSYAEKDKLRETSKQSKTKILF